MVLEIREGEVSTAPSNINVGNSVPSSFVVKVFMSQGEPWHALQIPGHSNTVLFLTCKI